MNRVVFQSTCEDDTQSLGAALADALPNGVVVGLNGTLGAGKTRLVQAIAATCGIDSASVISPTFVLVREYHGRRTIFHFDAYRLEDEDQFIELGPEEYFEADGICLVEWSERVAESLPSDRIEINIVVTGNDARQFEIIALGTQYDLVIEEIAQWRSAL